MWQLTLGLEYYIDLNMRIWVYMVERTREGLMLGRYLSRLTLLLYSSTAQTTIFIEIVFINPSYISFRVHNETCYFIITIVLKLFYYLKLETRQIASLSEKTIRTFEWIILYKLEMINGHQRWKINKSLYPKLIPEPFSWFGHGSIKNQKL